MRLFLVPLLALFAVSARAQYAIDWHTIAGGGGTSTGLVYSVSGTIAQPTASDKPLTGGSYALTGGFWSLLSVVQTPGAPLLSIESLGNQAVVWWPPTVTGWTLQTNSHVGTTNWGNYAASVVNNRATNPAVSGQLFFRLRR